jgi:leucyl aminopeptidase (aminopeptidase T)
VTTSAAYRRLFTVHLGLRPRDRVLVLAEPETAAFAGAIAEAGRSSVRVRLCVYPATGGNGVEPAEIAWRAALGGPVVDAIRAAGVLGPLLAKRATAAQLRRAAAIVRRGRLGVPAGILFINRFSLSHTKFRWLLTDVAGARVGSCPGLRPEMFRTAMRAAARPMAARTERLARLLSRAARATVTAPGGTRFACSLRGRAGRADTGLVRPGTFSNLPAGEAYIAPVEGTGEGTVVAGYGRGGAFPGGLRFALRRGRAAAVTGGGGRGRALAALFRRHPEFAVLAEFALGTNERATTRTSTLEAEKILGTVHVAFGDNATFGGRNRAEFHSDFVVFRPTVTLVDARGRGRIVLDQGSLKIR